MPHMKVRLVPILLALSALLPLMTTAYDIRLINNSGPLFGTVEFRINATSPWGYVCYNHVSVQAAGLMCAYMGFPTPSPLVVKQFEDNIVNESAIISNITCPATATSITQCFVQFGDAETLRDPSESIAINCNAPPPSRTSTWEFDLVLVNPGTSTTRGRLEMRPNSTAEWGTVCSVGFTQQDALAACFSVGFTNISVAYFMTKYPGQGPIYLSSINCNASTKYLQNCSTVFDFNSCTHSDDVTLECNGIVPVDDSPIILYNGTYDPRVTAVAVISSAISTAFNFNASRVWVLATGTISPYAWFTFEIRSAQTVNYYSQPTRADIDYFLLNMDDNSLQKLFLFRNLTDNSTQNYRPPSMQFRLAGTEHNATYGRLEVLPFGETEWGTICTNYFDSLDAMAACHSLGFMNTTVATVLEDFGGGNGTIYLNEVSCTSSDVYLQNCSYKYYTAAAPTSDCVHDYDVGVDCTLETLPPPTTTTTTTTTTTMEPTTTSTTTTSTTTEAPTTTTTTHEPTTTTTTEAPTTTTEAPTTSTTTTTVVPTTSTTTTTTEPTSTTTTSTDAPTTTSTTTTTTTATPTTTTTTTAAPTTSTTTSAPSTTTATTEAPTSTTTEAPTSTTTEAPTSTATEAPTSTEAPTTTTIEASTTEAPMSTSPTTTDMPLTTTPPSIESTTVIPPVTSAPPITTTTSQAPASPVPSNAGTTSATFGVVLFSSTSLGDFKANVLYLLGISATDCCLRMLVVSTGVNQASFFFTASASAPLTATDVANQLVTQYNGNSVYVLMQLGASQLLLPTTTSAPNGEVKPWMWGVAAGGLAAIIVFYAAARTIKARRRANALLADNEVQFVSMNSVA